MIVPSLGNKVLDIIDGWTYNGENNGEGDGMGLVKDAPSTEKSRRLEQTGKNIGQITAEKNLAYGDSAGTSEQMLKLLWPDGVPQESYTDMLLLVRIWDKMKRIATDKDALGESPFLDIGGYAVLGAEKDAYNAEQTP